MADQYDDDELGGIVKREIENADGGDSDHLTSHREKALDYYYNRTRGDEKPGESQVQSSDVADMTSAVLAQLTPMISNDALVSFKSSGEADEEQARSETSAINKLVMDDNQGFVELEECLKDAALCRNAFAKVWQEEEETVEVRRIQASRGDVRRILAQLNQPEGQEAGEDEYDQETKTSTIKVIARTTRWRWRSVDPMHFIYEAGHDSLDLQTARFCAERDLPTRSDLIAEGYDETLVAELDALSAESEHWKTARNQTDGHVYDPQTADQEKIERHECYLRIDMDGDGISELWQVIVANKSKVLDKRLVQWVPFAVGTLFIQAHRLEGEDLYDRMKQTQDIKTATYRRWLDSMYNMAWGRLAAQLNVVSEDIDDARSGATIWCKGPPAQALMEVPVADVGPSAMALLQYEDQRRTERAGAALDMQSADAQLVGDTFQGIQKQYSVKEQLAQMMAKNMAETLIRQIYLLMHRTVRTFSTQPLSVELQGKWVQVDPRGWPARLSVNVTPGLTPSARTAITQAMGQVLQLNVMALQNGLAGQIGSLGGAYRAAVDMARAQGVPDPEQYLIDPSSEQAQMAAQQAGQQAQQQAQMQQQLLQMQISLEREKLALEQRKAQQDLFKDLYKTDMDAELKEAKLAVDVRQQDVAAQAAETAAAANGTGGQ